jgi:hypothetical protein
MRAKGYLDVKATNQNIAQQVQVNFLPTLTHLLLALPEG